MVLQFQSPVNDVVPNNYTNVV